MTAEDSTSKQQAGPGAPESRRYDVAIVGGGLVGASLVCALAPLGLRIALIEAVAFRAASQPSYDDRTLAMSATSCRILDGLGLWDGLASSATPIREIQVRELGRPGRVVMRPEELGRERFGNVVEARAFGATVMERLPQLDGLDFHCPASVTRVRADEGGALVEFSEDDGGRRIEASLLVGADGAQSFVRKALGIAVRRHDYGQTAVICNVTPERDHRGTAYECFTPTGPFAVMPHVGGRCGLIWCVRTGEAPALLEMREAEFLERANARFGGHLGRFVKIGRRSSYPLRLVRALQDTAPRAVILGNAAHAIHPVGAQGFNLGLRDVAVLAEVIADEVRGPGSFDAGAAHLLKRYSRWREADHRGTIAYSDGLARVFSNPSPLAAAARGVGMMAHALLPPLRRRMAVQAMGYRGHIPRLAVGEPL
ncbi:MAG: 2-octaprenyl-6-methoxyphenyl hydroxylase [Lysobacterales bacterium]